MTSYSRGERVPKLGVYHFTMAEPDEDSELLPEESDEEQPIVATKTPSCNCSCKRLCIGLVITVLVAVILVLSVVLTLGVMMPLGSNNAFPARPPMGWTSLQMNSGPSCVGTNWNVIRQVVQMLEIHHLRDMGYKFIIIDGCWQKSRNSSGYLQPNKTLGGFKGLTEHTRWLRQERFKLGISTGVGQQTCHNKPGSLNHEAFDMAAFHKYWKAEYITADNCFLPPNSNQSFAYTKLYTEIKRKYSKLILHVNATFPVAKASSYGHIRKVVPWTMLDEWGDMMAVVDKVIEDELWKYAKPGFWNDLGPLTVGARNMRYREYEAQFALWCIFKSQLFLSGNPFPNDKEASELIKNEGLIGINQDVLGESAKLVNEANAAKFTNQFLVVARPCGEYQEQLWTYYNKTNTLESVKFPGQCLKYGSDKYASVVSCNPPETDFVKWQFKPALPPDDPKDYHLVSYVNAGSKDRECLTLSTHKGVPAVVRLCSKRKITRNWQGSNQAWHGYNDAFEVVHHGSHFKFKNKANMCFSVGGAADKQIFAGNLSKKRKVVLLLNRTPHQQNIHLQFKHLEIDLSKKYILHELLTNTSHGDLKDAFETIVKGRSVNVFTMTPV